MRVLALCLLWLSYTYNWFVSRGGTGVLAVACCCLLDCLGRLPGDARTLVGFLTYDSSLHFYNLSVSVVL